MIERADAYHFGPTIVTYGDLPGPPAAPRRRGAGRGTAIAVIAGVVAALLAIAVPALLPGGPRVLPAAPAGLAAPDFSLRSLGGADIVRLSAYRGRPVVVNFWASWCDPCKEEAAALAAAERRWRQRGVVFLGVNSQDTASGALAYVQANAIAYRNVVDPGSDIERSYGVTGFPETFFIDAGGTIRAKEIAALDAATIDRSIATILG